MDAQKSVFDEEVPNVTYVGLWSRVLASLIDALVMVPIFIAHAFNNSTWKSNIVLVILSFIVIAYKPLLEYKYGATLGKMAMKMVVVSKDYNRITLQQAILRDIFSIVYGFILLALTLFIYRMPGFETANTYRSYTAFVTSTRLERYPALIIGFIYLAEAIFIAADDRSRALHDRIAGTYIIKR